jgi:replication factor A1
LFWFLRGSFSQTREETFFGDTEKTRPNGLEAMVTLQYKRKKRRNGLRKKGVPVGEYLAFLSIKYKVDPDKFFQALTSTKEHQKSICGNLSIECRGKIKDKVIFLITEDSKVVAQFRISEEFLLERGNPLRKFMETGMIRRHLAKNSRVSQSTSIRDLRTGMKHVNLKAKVLEIPKPTLVYTRFGNSAIVANVLIEDETGKIKLCLWNDQIDSVSVGDTIQIENARASTFRGEKQLRLGHKGTLSISQGCAITANTMF